MIIKTAKLLLDKGDYDSCISRCYYVLFHIAIVMLEQYGIKQEKWEHKFVLAEFNKQFIYKRKIFSAEIRNVFYDILDERNKADYSPEEQSFKKAKRIFEKTEKIFYHIIKEIENDKKK